MDKMVIFKMELVEGNEIFYENPFKNDVAVGASIESLKENPREKAYILKQGESLSVKATHIFIRIL